jgi:hypothetical protein
LERLSSTSPAQGALTRHDLPGGVAISFVFDGDPDRPRTCQWRVAAAEESALRSAVSGLLAERARAGVEVERPRCSGGVCNFQDFGPWPDCP